jgi:hypothetical protein
MIAMKSQINAFEGLLSVLAGRFQQNPAAMRAIVFAAFKKALGKSAVQYAVPADLDNDVLVISVYDKTWKRNLESLSPAILAKITAIVGFSVIRRIEFRIAGPEVFIQGKSDDLRKYPKAKANAPKCPDEIRQKAQIIRDPALRQTFTEAAGACLSIRQNDTKA